LEEVTTYLCRLTNRFLAASSISAQDSLRYKMDAFIAASGREICPYQTAMHLSCTFKISLLTVQ
jgi:hypothetical protein